MTHNTSHLGAIYDAYATTQQYYHQSVYKIWIHSFHRYDGNHVIPKL